MKAVSSYNSLDEALLAASFLEGSGLSPNVRDVHTASMYMPQVIGGVVLEVPDSEYEQALNLMELPAATETELQCPSCGSHDVKLRGIRWPVMLMALITFVPLASASRKAVCLNCKAAFSVR